MEKAFALVLVNVVLSVAGQICLKVGMVQIGRIGREQIAYPVDLALRIFTSPLVLVALVLYGSAFTLWTIVLSRIQLSVAYPALALIYVLIPLASWLVLGESVSTRQWIGIVVICLGVFLVVSR